MTGVDIVGAASVTAAVGVLVAEAVERMHAGRSGMYDVRVCTADGEVVAEFRGHTRTIRGKAEG